MPVRKRPRLRIRVESVHDRSDGFFVDDMDDATLRIRMRALDCYSDEPCPLFRGNR